MIGSDEARRAGQCTPHGVPIPCTTGPVCGAQSKMPSVSVCDAARPVYTTDGQTASLALVSSCGTHRYRYGKTADEWLHENIVSYETLSRLSRHAHLLLQGLRLARRVFRFHTSISTVLCLKNASVFYLFTINPIYNFEISCFNILLQYVLLIEKI